MNQPRANFPVTLVIAKEGELCWLGHLDFARAIERALRRADLPLHFTEGFHKRPRMRLPEPLPLGVGSAGERFVVLLAAPVALEEVAARLRPCLPTGLRLCAALSGSRPEPRDAPVELSITSPMADALSAAVAALDAELPAIGGTWTRVATVDAPGLGGAHDVVVRLTPPAGGRVSVGRFLKLLRERAGPGFAFGRIHRRAPWHEEESSLPSPAPFGAPSQPTAPPSERQQDAPSA